jgi:hypothetical protein
METEMVCFPEPLNVCIPLTYSSSATVVPAPDDNDDLATLRELGEPGCYLCALNEFVDDDWD